MLKVWGRTNSINVQKVIWTLDELRVPYERIDAGLHFGVNNTPEYLKMNPNGRVPTIDDDGFILWESNAVVRYLAAKHSAGSLWPNDLKQRADSDRWMDWIADNVALAISPVFLQLVRTPSEKRDMRLVEVYAKKANDLFQILDGALTGKKYIVGDAFTMGDIVIGVFVHRWYALDIARPELGNVAAYYERLKGRPVYSRHVVKPLT